MNLRNGFCLEPDLGLESSCFWEKRGGLKGIRISIRRSKSLEAFSPSYIDSNLGLVYEWMLVSFMFMK